mgnify:CR=1 FL=1
MKTEESYMTNLTKLYILVLLHESPRHGYELMEELGKRTGKKPSAGQIYPLLKKLRIANLKSKKVLEAPLELGLLEFFGAKQN